MYDRLEREAYDAGLPLRWPSRLPNSRYALAVAEWVRRHHSEGFTTLYHQLFLSHYSLGEDISDTTLVNSYAEQAGADLDLLQSAISDGSADAAVAESEAAAHRVGIAGTPGWLIENHVVFGLHDKGLFRQVAHEVADHTRDEKDPRGLL